MVNRNDPKYDKDKVYCAISLEIMQHPVQVFPSKKYYELACLIESIRSPCGLICPLTREPIEAVAYDLVLKKQLDDEYHNAADRYKKYNCVSSMLSLQLQIKIKKNAAFTSCFNTDMGLSVSLAGISWSIIKLLCRYDIAETSDGLCYLLAASIGTIDYGLRKVTRSNFGLFTVMTNTVKSAYQLFTYEMNDEQSEALSNLRV